MLHIFPACETFYLLSTDTDTRTTYLKSNPYNLTKIAPQQLTLIIIIIIIIIYSSYNLGPHRG